MIRTVGNALTLSERIERQEQREQQRPRRAYYSRYTIVFIVVAAITFGGTYLLGGRSPIWTVDTISQPYTFFIYEGNWLREFFANLFSGSFAVPVWESSFGYGSDIVTTLGEFFFDPFNFISVLCPAQYSEYLYDFTVIARLYVAGLAFSVYALHRGCGRLATLLGSLIYCFSASALVVVFWPGSSVPLILFPFLLTGAERMLEGKGPALFMLMCFALFLLDFYFAYAACLLLLLYCALRVVQTQGGCLARTESPNVTGSADSDVERHLTAGIFLKWVAAFLGALLVGFLMSCVILVPTIAALLSTSRLSDSTTIPLLYTIDYYRQLFRGFISWSATGNDYYIGFAGTTLLAVFCLFATRRKNRGLKTCFIVLTVFLLIPYVGHVFNGFNYVTSRWLWAYALLVAFIFSRTLPDLAIASRKRDITLVVCLLVYGAIAVVLCNARKPLFLLMWGIAFVLALVLLSRRLTSPMRRTLIATATLLCVLAFPFDFLGIAGKVGWAVRSVDLGTAYGNLTEDSATQAIANLDDGTFWRYDAGDMNGSGTRRDDARYRNSSLVQNIHGIDFYWSLYNNDIDRFHTELGICGTDMNYSYTSLDARAYLEAVASVRYFLAPDNSDNALPYGYDNAADAVASTESHGRTYTVYEGADTLPLAFVYSSYVPRSTYLGLTMAARQQALLQGVVLDDASAASDSTQTATSTTSLAQTDLTFTDKTIPWTVSASDGVTVEDGAFIADHNGATLTISFDGLSASETYLELTGLTAKVEPSHYTIGLTSDMTGSMSIGNYQPNVPLYGNKTDWFANIGYADAAQTSLTLKFSSAGTYTFSSCDIVCQPMDGLDSQIDALKETSVTDITEGPNSYSMSVNMDDVGFLYLSVPYSTGWSVTVDGEPATVQKANTAFMGVELPSGSHEVVFSYRTPWLGTGAALSGIGLLLFVGTIIWRKRRQARMATRQGM